MQVLNTVYRRSIRAKRPAHSHAADQLHVFAVQAAGASSSKSFELQALHGMQVLSAALESNDDRDVRGIGSCVLWCARDP